MNVLKKLILPSVAALALVASASANLFTYTVPTGGITTNGEYGDTTNNVLNLDLGAGSVITGIGWNITIQTIAAGSYRSEASFAITNTSDTDNGVFVGPGTDNSSGGPTTYSSGGVLDLTDNNVPDITLGTDGLARMEFYDSFDDALNAPDGLYLAGSTIQIEYTPQAVPEPATIAALGLGCLAVLRRRKKA